MKRDHLHPASGASPPGMVRLALMKAVPEKWDLSGNFELFRALFEGVRARGVDLFVTPECWLDGYAAADAASTKARLQGIAQDLDHSEFLTAVAQLAAEHRTAICFGFTSLEEGRTYNAAGLWDGRGERLGVYHKTHLQNHDLQFSPGKELPVYATPWGPLGIMICADRRWPEVARALRLQGAKLILNPSYGMHHEENEWWMRTRGYENQCFIAFAHPKVAFIVAPDGNLEGKLDDEAPGLLLCDLDLTRARDDNHLRDRRPELYGIITEPR